MVVELIDSHVHFWDRQRFDYRWLDAEPEVLRPNHLPPQLAENRPPLEGVVAVQADCRDDQALDEAAWLNGLDTTGALIRAVVAQVPLELGDGCADHLGALSQLPRVRGVRRLLQGEARGFALQADFLRGVGMLERYGFVMDLCIRDGQLPEVTEVVRRSPGVVFVLDHLGKPTISADAFDRWATDLTHLAALPNVRCKLSGLASEAPEGFRTAAALLPWLAHAIEVFGPARCMFGSDWPVVTSVASYELWGGVVASAVAELSAFESEAIMSATALATYVQRR